MVLDMVVEASVKKFGLDNTKPYLDVWVLQILGSK